MGTRGPIGFGDRALELSPRALPYPDELLFVRVAEQDPVRTNGDDLRALYDFATFFKRAINDG